MREARRFFEDLPPEAGKSETVVFNKQLPESWTGQTPLRGAEVAASVRTALRDNLTHWAAEVRRQHDIRQQFAARHDLQLIEVPWADASPTSVEALADLLASAPELAEHLPG